MGKALPVTEKGRRTRTAITAAAARLMHDRGIAATSLDDVLAESGTGKSQLYHYFEDKADLVAAMLRHMYEMALANQPSLTDPAAVDLFRWRDDVLAAHARSGYANCPLGAFASQVSNDPALRAVLAELFESWRTAIAGLVDRSRAAGLVAPTVDSDDAGLALLTALQGGTLLTHVHNGGDGLARALDHELAVLHARRPAPARTVPGKQSTPDTTPDGK
jgi:TetR/AcrR family transcriptional regulator, transcriptional repressor for nem operon